MSWIRGFMKPTGYVKFNLREIANALGITEKDTQIYFTDGRRVSFLIERRAVDAMPGSTLAPSEGSGYDLIDANGGKWEVRSLTRGGIYFCPSFMVGSGRSFDEKGFLAKLSEIDGYFVTDITQFPEMPYWIISYSTIEQLWNDGKLGGISKITRNNFLQLISQI